MAPKSIFPKMLKGGYKKLEEMIDKEKDPKVKDRLRAIYWKFKKASNAKIARNLNCTSATVSTWISNWNKQGYEGLLEKKSSGRLSILTSEEEEKVINFVKNEKQERVTCKKLAAKIKEDFDKDISPESVRVLLKKNNLSWKKPKKEDYRKDEEKRKLYLEAFEKKDRQFSW